MSRARISRIAMPVVVAVASFAIAACDHPRLPDAIHPEVTDYTKRHPIVVTPQSETVAIAVGRGGAARDYAYMETTRFLRQYKRSTSGALYVSLPGHDSGASSLVRTVVQREGIPAERVKWSANGPAGTLTLSYDRVAAIGPVCGNWQEDVTRNPDRVPYPDFGCFQQRAIAAMAANPTDLVYPARETPRIGAERPGAPKSAKSGNATGGGADPGAAPPAAGSPAASPPPASAQ
ncbi:MAG: CpaD family pilus assembly protein [Hyphomicrobiaceae bacterium]|nr:CpaD family pilus assembly protein [Hyphomicrobiaceae bacterium]